MQTLTQKKQNHSLLSAHWKEWNVATKRMSTGGRRKEEISVSCLTFKTCFNVWLSSNPPVPTAPMRKTEMRWLWLVCHFGRICNHLGNRVFGVPVKDYLNYSNWDEKACPQWVASFPGWYPGLYKCIKAEACIHSFRHLSCGWDVTRCFKLLHFDVPTMSYWTVNFCGSILLRQQEK